MEVLGQLASGGRPNPAYAQRKAELEAEWMAEWARGTRAHVLSLLIHHVSAGTAQRPEEACMGWRRKKTRPRVSPEWKWVRSKHHDGRLESPYKHAIFLMYTGQFARAEGALDEVQRKRPQDATKTLYYRGLNKQLQGDFSPETLRASWWRGQDVSLIQQRFRWFDDKPLWDGTAIPGQRLMIWLQRTGYGDAFQLCRLLPTVKEQSQAHVILGVHAGMRAIFQSLQGPDELIEPPLEEADFDAHAPLDLIPCVPSCAFTATHFHMTKYLTPDAQAVARWAPMFADQEVVHVGVHFAAEKSHRHAAPRTIPLEALAPAFDVPGARFYSLQPGAATELAAFPDMVDLGSADDTAERFVQTAGILTHLDVVVCCDSSIGHLAGVLQRPTLLLLDVFHDVRWEFGRSDSRWYPCHALYHMPHQRDWRTMACWVAEDLEGRVGQKQGRGATTDASNQRRE
jgi:hypothetical protein